VTAGRHFSYDAAVKRLSQLGVAAALAAAVAALASRLPVPEDKPYDVPVIPPTSVVRWLALGHPTLAANLYYLRAVQYVGEPRGNERGWDRLYPLVDLVTDLDPGHGYAYQVAGTLLGSVHRVQESNAILEKGIRLAPSRYILPFLRAFNAFYYAGDYAEAGRFVEIAANTPGAPDHLRQNVLAMYAKGHRAEAALAFLRHARDAAVDDETRKAIDEQVKQAILERDATALDDAIDAYRARVGLPPLTLAALVASGLVDRIPDDPYGGLYVLGHDGRVHSSVNDFRFSVPTGARRREPGIQNQEAPQP
jgi:tetratricopeptide (TPR) repeat protein